MTSRALQLAAIFAAVILSATAQMPKESAVTARSDAVWAKAYATDCGAAMKHPCPPSSVGYENEFTWDLRLPRLLHSAFPQHQWFWFDHHKLTSVPDLVLQFIGVPGSLLVDQDRYVTADGCVPHDCSANRGMIWIDTGTQPATLIFAGTDLIGGSPNVAESYHLWIFSSTKLNWQHLPPAFSASLTRWLSIIAQRGYRETSGYSFNFILATIVQPNGVMEDLTPETLHIRSIEPGAKQ